MTIEQIRKLCYELYKIDWKISHMITPEMEKNLVRNYYEEVVFSPDFDGDYSLEDYVFDYGYGGQLYVCYDEFLGAEYLDKDYVLTLLPENSDVRVLYLQDITMNELKTTPEDFIWRIKNPEDYWANAKEEVKYDVYLNNTRRGGFIGINRTFDDDRYYVNYYDENNSIAYCTVYSNTEIILKRVP